MKNLYFSILWVTILLFSTFQNANATHIVGADFSYICVGQDSFLVTLNLYRDCTGISAPSNTFANFNGSCGISLSQSLSLQNGLSGTEVSQLSPSNISNSSCNGGNLPGVQKYIYSSIVVLSSSCNTWTMSWASCCRNTSINVPNSLSNGFYVDAVIKTNTSSCNNSPVFNGIPIPYVCSNQQTNYNVVASEPDGDSLVYSFVTPFDSPSGTMIPVIFGTGYSYNSPIPGININSANGQITFTATIAGNYILAVKIDEYEYGTGLLRGTVTRDFQFVVLGACGNSHPVAPASFSNFTGTATLLGNDSILACVGNDFSFDIIFTDSTPLDSIILSSNISTQLPGATITITNGNPAILNVSWVVATGTPPLRNLIVTGVDQGAPTYGFSSKVFTLLTSPSTETGADITICEGTQWAQVNATGGTNFTWSLLSGSPIDTMPSSPGYNMSCTNCANPQISPNVTSTYVVVSNLTGVCVNVDTITIAVAPNFDLTMPNDTLICPNNSINLNASTNQPFSYTHQWSPSGSLNHDSILVPTASPNSPTLYSLTTTSSSGCQKTDTVFVDVTGNFPANMLLTGDTVLCNGQATSLVINDFSGVDSASLNYSWYPTTGLSTTNYLSTLATPLSSTTYHVIVSDTAGICIDTVDFFVDIVSTFDAGFNFNDPYCISASTDQVTPNVGGGTFTGNGINANGIFNPALAGIGSWPITYSITSPASCANDSTINIVVIPLPDATIDFVEVCIGSAPINLTAVNPGGTWSGAGITNYINGTFDPSGLSLGTYNVAYSLTQPCTNSDTFGVRVVEPYNFSINPANLSVCAGSTLDLGLSYTLSSSPNQGSGPVLETWTNALGAVTSDGIFHAENLTAGTYQVSLEITGMDGTCGTQQTLNIVVLQTDIPAFSSPISFCEQATSANLNVVPGLFGTGSTFTQNPLSPLSPSQTLAISSNGTNGEFNPSLMGVGSWEITITYTNVNGCTGSIIDTITVAAAPDNTVSVSAAGLSSNANGAYTYQWLDCNTNLPIPEATNQTFEPTVSGNYAVVVTAGSCEATSNCTFSNAVGIADLSNHLDISTYPNPVLDILKIDKGNNTNLTIEIFDFTGKSISIIKAKSQKTKIDMSSYAAGVYLINLTTENGSMIQKIIKE